MSSLSRINQPPVYADIDNWIWKQWLEDIYVEFLKESQPNEVLTSSSTNLTLGLNFFYQVDATGAATTVYLPAANLAKGKKYIIKKIDSSVNIVTIDANGSDTIDGSSTKTLTAQYDAIFIESDGLSTWHVLLSSGGGGGGSGAPIDATYVVMSNDATLTQERVLTAGTGISITDGGANSTVTISSTVTGQQPIYVYFA